MSETTITTAQAAQLGRSTARLNRIRRDVREELVRLSDEQLHREAEWLTRVIDAIDDFRLYAVGEDEPS